MPKRLSEKPYPYTFHPINHNYLQKIVPLLPTYLQLFMDTLIPFLVEWGYLGLFLAAFIAVILFPFSSEAVLVVLVQMGLHPIGCLIAATLGNTLGGMTCYWIGSLGKSEWIARLGISEQRLSQARRFLAGRGALMGFFGFLPVIGEAIAVVLGLMHSNLWLTTLSMFCGKALRYIFILYLSDGVINLFFS